jgi:murein DD-endopeptidase MepM/ murein hydrolase activator NlpD
VSAVSIVVLSGLIFWNQDLPITAEPIVLDANFKDIQGGMPLDSYGLPVMPIMLEDRIKKNESLYTILSSMDVSDQIIQNLSINSRGTFKSKSLRPGQRYLVYKNAETDQVERFILHLDKVHYVVFDWTEDISVIRAAKEISTTQIVSNGIITSSLYETLVKNGVDPVLGNKLSDIFGWQINFFRLQPNDEYEIVYEQQFVDGEPYRIGSIIAANFTHNNTLYDAYYYQSANHSGYYDSKAKGTQKALLKAPFKYSQRISSGYSHNRFHPVLKKNMPHYGIDYAAPLGTPVMTVGDGTIIEATYRGANGNIVKVKHNSIYVTAYLHLNGFAKGIKPGAKVKQGQIIGYVGRTGRVTGVHLDYRMYKNNVPVNPLTIDLPSMKALEGTDLENFKLYIERYRHLMRTNTDLQFTQVKVNTDLSGV